MILGVLLVDHAWTMKVYMIPSCARGPRERGAERVGGHGELFPDACACPGCIRMGGESIWQLIFFSCMKIMIFGDFQKILENPWIWAHSG